jgi:type II secretory pathway component PulC
MTCAITITINLSGMNRLENVQLKIAHAANFIHRERNTSEIHRKSINFQASSFSEAHRYRGVQRSTKARGLPVRLMQAHRRLSVNVNGITFDRETEFSLIVIGIERGWRLVEPSVV